VDRRLIQPRLTPTPDFLVKRPFKINGGPWNQYHGRIAYTLIWWTKQAKAAKRRKKEKNTTNFQTQDSKPAQTRPTIPSKSSKMDGWVDSVAG
jgi:hypothetical protein